MNTELASSVSAGPGLETLVEGKVATLRGLLAQIVVDVDARLALSGRVDAAVAVAVCAVESDLWLVQREHVVMAGREGVLEERLLRLEGERRQEWVRCWQDVAVLRVEARRTWREYQDLVGRLALLVPYGRRESEAGR
jgi:hypothetical protein